MRSAQLLLTLRLAQMATKLTVYGDTGRFRSTLARQVARGRDLQGQLLGVKNLMPEGPNSQKTLLASARRRFAREPWIRDVQRWRVSVNGSLRRHLAEQATKVCPTTTAGGPTEARMSVTFLEPWLEEAIAELDSLRGSLGVRRNVAAAAPRTTSFAELVASGLVDVRLIDAKARDMRDPRTPKQLSDAIDAAKELTEATLKASLDRLQVARGQKDDLPLLMKKWRRRVDELSAPGGAAKDDLDLARSALTNLVTFLGRWRNRYGAHAEPAYPPDLKPRHALLAVNVAETAIRFIVMTMDDLEQLPTHPGQT